MIILPKYKNIYTSTTKLFKRWPYNYSNDLGLTHHVKVNGWHGKYFWPLTLNTFSELSLLFQNSWKCIYDENENINYLHCAASHLNVANFINFLKDRLWIILLNTFGKCKLYWRQTMSTTLRKQIQLNPCEGAHMHRASSNCYLEKNHKQIAQNQTGWLNPPKSEMWVEWLIKK